MIGSLNGDGTEYFSYIVLEGHRKESGSILDLAREILESSSVTLLLKNVLTIDERSLEFIGFWLWAIDRGDL